MAATEKLVVTSRRKKMTRVLMDSGKDIMRCPVCGCIFEYEQEDIFLVGDINLNPGAKTYVPENYLPPYRLRCPECNFEMAASPDIYREVRYV